MTGTRFAIGAALSGVVACWGEVAEPPSAPQPPAFEYRLSPIRVAGSTHLERLLAEEDTDGDKKITVADGPAPDGRGDRRFELIAEDGQRYEVTGTYQLSNLLQELTLGLDSGEQILDLDPGRLWEAPTERISRSIEEIYWDGLTRRIDGEHLAQVLSDEKFASESGRRHLYVPFEDASALEYFCGVAAARPELRVQVEMLSEHITPSWVRSLDPASGGPQQATPSPCKEPGSAEREPPRHGLLVLALERSPDGPTQGVPFVVPGGRFNEMYGWDSYFEALGLLDDGRVDLAKAMVDNFVYQIRHYGKILNANRTYYLMRSQPPFLTSMATAVYEHLPPTEQRREWLRYVILAAIQEHETVWLAAHRLTETGLSRYFGRGMGPPPEVEPGHFDAIYGPYAAERGMEVREFERAYRVADLRIPEIDQHFVHDRCMRESGHDTTYRWDRDGDRCADFATVDLNSLLYKTEVDVARVIRDEFGGHLERPNGTIESSEKWYGFAKQRRERIRKLLWDEDRQMFFDYDVAKGSRHPYVSATTLYPLWAWNPNDPESRLLSDEQARALVKSALPLLEMPGGVAASARQSRGPVSDSRPERQWDYPNGWAPHQMLIWQGLRNHGFDDLANRLIYRWLYTITINAVEYNGTVPEKFDVVRRSHRVFAEYGNVGTQFDYITREGFGWMNASYQVGLALLPEPLRAKLDRLIPPEWVDFDSASQVARR